MAVIVCFGDSNTWGCMPRTDAAVPPQRYEPEDRWPGVLADELRPGVTVISEGLNSRTTCFDDPIEGEDRNGRRALIPCIETHHPVDLVVIYLGVNDLKVRFALDAVTIAASAVTLAATAAASPFGPSGGHPEVLLVVPPPTCIGAKTTYLGHFAGADETSSRFGECFRAAGDLAGIRLLDASAHIESSPVDGIHLEREAHHALGRAVADWVRANMDLGSSP